MAKKGIQVAIYNIDTGLFPELDNEAIIQKIVGDYNNNLPYETIKPFEEQALREGVELYGFQAKIYYSHKYLPPRWKEFLEPILESDGELLRGENHYVSFVLFIYDDQELYAITGGQGNYLIQDYINRNFGTDIITRLISEDSKVIQYITERGLTGSLAASSKYYRRDYSLMDEDDFGKLYQQIKATLGPDILSTKLGLSPEELKKDVGCVAKSSFKLNKSISIAALLDLIKHLNDLLQEAPKFKLNNLTLLSKQNKSQKKLIDKLEYQLAEEILLKTDISSNLDICYYEYEKFLTADSYNLFKGASKKKIFEKDLVDIKNIEFIYDAIKKRNYTISSAEEMREFLQKTRLASFNDENQLTNDWLIKHINGEIKYNDESFFRIDGTWYQIENQFILNLDKELANIADSIKDPDLISESWNLDDDEECYIQNYIGKEGFLALHTVFINRIELCDLLKYDSETTHLIHIKKGFDNKMRDLTLQIDIAARALNEARRGNDYGFFEKYYNNMADKIATTEYSKKVAEQADYITKEKFKEIFMNNDIVFHLAFLDTANIQRDIINTSDFQSNIAKYSVIELYRRLKMDDIRLSIIQINRK